MTAIAIVFVAGTVQCQRHRPHVWPIVYLHGLADPLTLLRLLMLDHGRRHHSSITTAVAGPVSYTHLTLPTNREV